MHAVVVKCKSLLQECDKCVCVMPTLRLSMTLTFVGHNLETLLVKSVMLFARIGYIQIQRKSHIPYMPILHFTYFILGMCCVS